MVNREKNGISDLSHVRILAVINGIELFGHERGNIEVFKSLRELGAEVVVGVSNRTHDGVNQVEKALHDFGFETFRLPFGPQWSIQWVKKDPRIAISNLHSLLRSSWNFRKVMGNYRPTHIHIGSPLAYSYLSLALAFSKVPLIYRMGDCVPVDSPFNLRIWRMAMRRSRHVVANSQFVKQAALSAGVAEGKISVIHNLAPSTTGNEVNSALQREVDECSIRLVYAGAISEHKGLLPLIEAFAVVERNIKNLRLDILGGSRYDIYFREELIKLIAEHDLQEAVFLHGHVDDPSAYFQQASIHLAPSVWEEPFANVVLEAKREGLPSIIFPSGGLPEMIHHQVDGYICKEKSVEALVEGLLWILDDTDRLKRMGKAAGEDSDQRFGRDRFAVAWAGVYLDAV